MGNYHEKLLKLIQGDSQYRFSLDPFILAGFLEIRENSSVIDLGTGVGVLLFLIHSRFLPARTVGIEIQKDLVEIAERNVREQGLAGKIEILEGDIRNIRNLFEPGSFDAVVSNPPFRRADDGRINLSPSEAVARHEIQLTQEELIGSASHLLNEKGRLSLIYHPYRLAQLIETLPQYRFEPKRLRFVYPKTESESSMVLVEAVKGGKPDLKVLPPFFIHGSEGEYSEEMKRCYPAAQGKTWR